MPTKRTSLILSVALLSGLLASYLVVLYVRRQEHRLAGGRVEQQRVVVATSDLPIGARLTAGVVAARDWPKDGSPDGVVSEPEAVLGRLVKGEIARGEPILEHRLFPRDLAGAPGIMSVIVPPGKRAMTVGVNEVIGVSGFILPKSRVDAIATKTDARGTKSTETILQSVEVLAVGQRLDQRGDQAVQVPTVTMAVTPQEAERVALALHEGKIHLVLRSVMDSEVVHLAKPTRPSSRRGEKKAAAPPPQARPTAAEAPGGKGLVVDVIRGDKRSLETHAAQ
jgi:pilus assembly protein CpaB